MNTKKLKIITTIIMAIFTICTIGQAVLAVNVDISVIAPTDTSEVEQVAGKILGLIQAAAGIAAVVLIAVFGFKFIMGSANEKADYQKSFIPLIVGVVVVFAATSIAKLIFSTFSESSGSEG